MKLVLEALGNPPPIPPPTEEEIEGAARAIWLVADRSDYWQHHADEAKAALTAFVNGRNGK